jgi:hypothetical protein
MDPAMSPNVFRDRLKRAGLEVEKLSAAEALAQMLAFYKQVRADRCMLDAEGDMLLFGWGTRDTRKGEMFQLEVTRQFIQPGDEDEDGISQIWVQLLYPMTPVLGELGEGEHWCERPSEAAEFEEFVLASEAYRAVVELTPERVEIDWASV